MSEPIDFPLNNHEHELITQAVRPRFNFGFPRFLFFSFLFYFLFFLIKKSLSEL